MKFLMAWYLKLGGKLQEKTLEKISDLSPEYSIIVNCSGADAYHLVPDPECFPIRGQYILLEKIPGLEKVLFGQYDEESYVLIAPRTQDCYIGGLTQNHNWNKAVDENASRTIWERAIALEPEIKDARIIGTGVGLRPGRKAVRLEAEIINKDSKIIHNYGHGGSGFTVCWGCAEEVTQLI